MRPSRRTFLKSVGVGGAVALTGTELMEFLSQAQEPEAVAKDAPDRGPLPPRLGEKWALGVCGLCPARCGTLVRVVDGKVVALRGNPFHPCTRGGLCPRGTAGAQLLYHPDRILAPKKRVGRRGEGKFESISWGQALDELAPRLKKAEGVMVVAGGGTSQLDRVRRKSLSGAKFLEHRPYYDAPNVDPAYFLTHGIWGHPAYDLENTDYILSFDSGLLERFRSYGETLRVFGRARQNGKCRLVHVEPRRSVTGSRADEWIGVRPGTEAILAYGIAHIMIKEGLIDRGFLEDHALGFEDWTDSAGTSYDGFRTRVLKTFDPRTTADATLVPIDAIMRLARSFSSSRRAIALGNDLPGAQSPRTRMAIHCLNALVGSIETPGGVLAARLPEPSEWWGEDAPPSEPVGESKSPLAGPFGPDAESVLRGLKNGPETLILCGTDLLGEAVDRAGVEGALAGSKLVVAMATLSDETVKHADLVLPTATYFEQFMDSWDHTSSGYPLVAVSRPVVEPMGESRPEAEIWLEINRRLSSGIGFNTYEEVVRAAISSKHGQGQFFGLEHEEAWAQVLENSGWKPVMPEDPDGFWESALKVGGWWDPIYYHAEWKRALRTPSGRFEFYPRGLERLLPQADKGSVRTFLPNDEVEPFAGEPFQVALQVFTPASVGGLAGRLSWLRALAGGHVDVEWDTWAEVNPETAREFGLRHGGRARLRSDAASIEVTVIHSPAVPPRMVAVPAGILATDTDPKPGANPLSLMAPVVEPFAGRLSRGTTWITVEAVG